MKVKTLQDKAKQDRLVTCNKKKLPHVMSKKQLVRFLEESGDIRNFILVFLGVFLGLRVGEVARLKWEDVNLELGEVKILDAKNTKRFKSGYGKDRIVPIMKSFRPFFLKWRAMNPDEEYVLPFHCAGDRMGCQNKIAKRVIRWFQERFHDALVKADLLEVDYLQKDGKPRHKYHVHTLRHVCGVNMRRCGMPIEDIRDFMGHEKVETTMVYAELTKDDLKESVDRYLNYPKQRRFTPPLESAAGINVMPDTETLRLVNENLRLQLALKNGQKEVLVENAYLSQQVIRT